MSNKRPAPILAKKFCVGLIALELAPAVNYWSDWPYGGPEVQKTHFLKSRFDDVLWRRIIYGRLGRSPITQFSRRTLAFGVQALTFALRTLTFGVQTPSSVCDRCVWYANIYVRMQTLKNHFFSYQLFIQLQGNRVLIDLGGRFHGSIAACLNNRPPPSLGWL